MAENNNYSYQTITRGGVSYIQVVLDGKIVHEELLPTATSSKPTEPQPAENAKAEKAKTETASTEAPATAETTEKKRLSAKAKKGLAIAGGVIGGAVCFLLGERRGHDNGTAEGYQAGYNDANSTAAASTNVVTDQTGDEAPE